MADIIGIGEALNSKVAEKAYDDAGSKPAKQVGELAEDVVKSARLVLFPFQIAAAIQDKFERTLERVASKVPPEKRINPKLQIVGPIFENMKYMDDNGVLYELFEELLARSIDSERIEEAHPSFILIISQLSRDEAIILVELKKNEIEIIDTLDYDRGKEIFSNRKIETTTGPKDKLLFPNMIDMYYSHLMSLSLVSWPIVEQKPIWDGKFQIGTLQIGTRRKSKVVLTDFGKFFVNACVPENGFRNK
jgi:hypothetical protein